MTTLTERQVADGATASQLLIEHVLTEIGNRMTAVEALLPDRPQRESAVLTAVTMICGAIIAMVFGRAGYYIAIDQLHKLLLRQGPDLIRTYGDKR